MHYNSSWKDLVGFQPLLGKLESLFKIIILIGQVPFVPRLIISALCLKLWCYFHFYAKFYQILSERKSHPHFQKSKCMWVFLVASLLSFWKEISLLWLSLSSAHPIEPAIFTGERKRYLVTTVHLFQGSFGMPQFKPYINSLVNKEIFWDQISLGPLYWDITIEWIMYNRFKLILPPSQITKGLPRWC